MRRCAARGVRGRPAGRGSHELASPDPRVPISYCDPGELNKHTYHEAPTPWEFSYHLASSDSVRDVSDRSALGVGRDDRVRVHAPPGFHGAGAAPAAVVRGAGGVHRRRPALLRLPRRHRRARLRRPGDLTSEHAFP
jgi:hypothetical protein